MKQSLPVLAIMAISILAFSSCKKHKDPRPAGPANTTEISEARTEGPVHLVSLDFSAGSETKTALTLSSTNSTTVHVRLSMDNAPLTAARLMPLPASSYSLSGLEFNIPANGSLAIPITINKTNLTVDTTYGLAFRIEEVNAGSISQDARSLVVKITLRNRFDGRYKVTGTMTDHANGAFVFVEHEINVITTSPTQVKVIPKQLGIEGIVIQTGINLSYYSNFGPVLNFSADNKIASMVNFYGQPSSNGRSAELDPSGTNKWDPNTKNIAVKFWMNQPAIITPHHTSFNHNWVYLGER